MYPTEMFQRALNVLSARREKAYLESAARKADIEKKIPQLVSIQTELSKIGLQISKVFLYSEDKKADIEKLHRQSAALQKKRDQLLIDNGYQPDDIKVKYQCVKCSDSGFIGEKMCACHIELLKELQRNDIRRVAPLDECTFESFDIKYYPLTDDKSCISPQEKAKRICESCHRYALAITSKCEHNLLLSGGTGLGKTHLSLSIANIAVNRGLDVTYGSAQNILCDLQNENFGRTDNLHYTENRILTTDLLILDDLGTEFTTAYTTACLYNVINTRILTKKPTVINTNLEIDELNDRYDDRITSRLSGCYTPLILIGNDVRYIK